jgi:hypothetical protein
VILDSMTGNISPDRVEQSAIISCLTVGQLIGKLSLSLTVQELTVKVWNFADSSANDGKSWKLSLTVPGRQENLPWWVAYQPTLQTFLDSRSHQEMIRDGLSLSFLSWRLIPDGPDGFKHFSWWNRPSGKKLGWGGVGGAVTMQMIMGGRGREARVGRGWHDEAVGATVHGWCKPRATVWVGARTTPARSRTIMSVLNLCLQPIIHM